MALPLAPQQAKPPLPDTGRTGFRLTMVLAGLFALAVGAVFGALWMVALVTSPGDAQSASIPGSLFALATFMGAALLIESAPAASTRARATFGARGPGVWLLAFLALLLAGQALLAMGGLLAGLFFPFVQFGAALTSALAVLATVTWRAGGEPAASVGAGLAYGGCVAATIALLIEGLLVAVLVIAVLGTTNIGADAQELLKAAEQAMNSAGPGAQVDPGMIADILLQPAVLIAAFGLFGLAGPLAEELAKGSGVAARRPATRYRAWFWGAAAGAGFGMTEAIALGGVLTTGWGAGMLVRAIAMVMHATMSGLAGLGWHAASVQRRRGFGLFLLACAVGGHMAWNSLVLGSVVAGITSAAKDIPALMGVASGAIFSLILLFFAIFLGFRIIARRLGEEEAHARRALSGGEPELPSATLPPPDDQAGEPPPGDQADE